MKLVIKNNDIYDIGHDDSINEYIIYLCTNDYVITKAYYQIYGESVLDKTLDLIQRQFATSLTGTINVPYNKTIEEVINELQS